LFYFEFYVTVFIHAAFAAKHNKRTWNIHSMMNYLRLKVKRLKYTELPSQGFGVSVVIWNSIIVWT